jgi:hypothetical protein
VNPESIEAIVQRQLDAYNSRDVETLVGIYHRDAKQFEFPTKLLANGSTEIRQRFVARFAEPNLKATLNSRIIQGKFVIDHETVTRSFPEGPGTIELTAIYEVEAAQIRNAWFIFGAKRLMRDSS